MSQAQNDRLKKAIEKKFGKKFGANAKLCRKLKLLGFGLEPTRIQIRISALIHLRESPIGQNGEFTALTQALSEELDVLVDKLFPLALYKEILPQKVNMPTFCRFANFGEHLTDGSKVANPIEMAEQSFLRNRIQAVLKTLSYREREVLKLRYGLADGKDHTRKEAAAFFNTTIGRIKEIEAKAIHKLQEPRRSEKLATFLD